MWPFKHKPKSLYRIRIVTLNSGKQLFYPEYKTSTYGYTQIVEINCEIVVMQLETKSVANTTEQEARELITKHIKSEFEKHANDIKEEKIVPFVELFIREELGLKQINE